MTLETRDPREFTFNEIKAHLGGVIPCYGSPTGCHLDDAANETCGDAGCLLLRLYRAGYTAGLEASANGENENGREEGAS